MITKLFKIIEYWIRLIIVFITNYLPVKVIRDDRGIPFLYRYHLFALTNDGPGVCIHHFVKSDPERGAHSHPWSRAFSIILCGGYDERIVKKGDVDSEGKPIYITKRRNPFTLNYLTGDIYHRVMIDENNTAWTLFFFAKRSKTWEMIDLDGKCKQMSTTISDGDGGWWNHVIHGLGLHTHLELEGKVIATVDIIVVAENKILLIKRMKDPFKDGFALPGGRVDPSKDVDLLAAAKRELKEETNLSDLHIEYITTVGNSTRDPRGFCLTNVFFAKLDKIPQGVRAGDDAIDYNWFDLDNLPEKIAFDHKEILDAVRQRQNFNFVYFE